MASSSYVQLVKVVVSLVGCSGMCSGLVPVSPPFRPAAPPADGSMLEQPECRWMSVKELGKT